MSESAKYLDLTLPFLDGVGVDVGSQGSPVVPWAISFDLPEPEYRAYCGHESTERIDVRGFMDKLPFADRSLPWIYCSHVIEDIERRLWIPLFRHWSSKIKTGGVIVVLVPERKRWADYVKRGGPPNCHHVRPEPDLGDITTAAKAAGLKCIRERMTDLNEQDYSILGVISVR